LPGGERATAVSARIEDALGWLVGVGAGQLATDAAPSLRWLGEMAVWATELVAHGAVVPTVVRTKRAGTTTPKGSARYRVRWVSAGVDSQRFRLMAARLPGAVAALEPSTQPAAVCRGVLNAAVDTVCRAGAKRLVAPAAAPLARTREDVSEAILAGLDGTPFIAVESVAAKMSGALDKWASPVTAATSVHLRVQLDAPDKRDGVGS